MHNSTPVEGTVWEPKEGTPAIEMDDFPWADPDFIPGSKNPRDPRAKANAVNKNRRRSKLAKKSRKANRKKK